MVLDYIRKGALCTLLSLGALVSPAIIPGNISSVYAQEQKENPKKQESRGLQELLSEEVKRLEEKEKTPDEYIRLAELYIDQRDVIHETGIDAKLKELQEKIKGKEGAEFEYLNLLLPEKIERQKRDKAVYEALLQNQNLPKEILSKIHALYAEWFMVLDDDACKAHLINAIELDPNNLTAYHTLFRAAFEKLLDVCSKNNPPEEIIKKTEGMVSENELHFRNATTSTYKLGTALDCMIAQYKILRAYSTFLKSAASPLILGNNFDKKMQNEIDQTRKKYIFEYANIAERALNIWSTPEDYANFCLLDLGQSGYLFLAEEPYLEEKTGQLKLINQVLKMHDAGIKLYKKSGLICYWKGRALFKKAEFEAGPQWRSSRLNSTAKRLCKEAITTLEFAMTCDDSEIKNRASKCLQNIKDKLAGKW